MADQTRRELLETAWTESEKDDDVAVVDDDKDLAGRGKPDLTGDVVEDSDTPEAGSEDSPVLEDKGKKIEKEPKKPAADETQGKEAAAAAAEPDSGDLGRPAEPVADKAPTAWKPGAREHWAKLPPDVRTEINRRELHIRQTLSQTAGVRQFAQEFAQVINPYSHLIRAQNSTPIQAVRNLMGTAAGLMQGSQQQKSAILAEICQNYGVDLVEFDKYLSTNWDVQAGRLKNGGNQQRMEAPPQWAQPLLAMQQQIQQTMEAQEQRTRQEADEKIAAMESQPFFEDLRDDIADIMEIAAKRNISMTIQKAYEKAIQLSPEISKIMTQRKKATDLAKGNKTISRARRASSSISGGPVGAGAGNKNSNEVKSRRDQISEAWENAE
jgi:hypothetical protein